MKKQFFYAYFVAGTIALILLIYQLINFHTRIKSYWNMIGDVILVLILYYLAFKTYHEAKDKELM